MSEPAAPTSPEPVQDASYDAASISVIAACSALDENANDASALAVLAKGKANDTLDLCGNEGVQMHGGIAMTYEYKAGHLFKRLTMIDTAYGDADVHVRRLADRSSLFA